MDIKQYLTAKKQEIDSAIAGFLPNDSSVLAQAMRYSALAPGKRIRAILAIESSLIVGGTAGSVMPVACALELIHTFSLIHDDLPAMDDDDMRRGIQTCHKKFGEAQAILAGDALFALAFEVISSSAGRNRTAQGSLLDVIAELSKAVGVRGMCLGQSVDLLSEGKNISYEDLRKIHRNKTGELIRASVHCGAVIGGAVPEQVSALEDFASHLGLAFQIKDDILDLKGTLAELGKTPGADLKKEKATYPSVLGMEKAERLLFEEKERTITALDIFKEKADVLKALAEYVVERNN